MELVSKNMVKNYMTRIGLLTQKQKNIMKKLLKEQRKKGI
jgi:hypothetical protein